eukprot:TRINITY_DN21274_c0_g1_i2.p1 TRINITY_DN21274_c0_g1~~TRINITY_DN21274_c0_g1_i2.p1  ORF type:complete len:441 (+),score=64.96 TRINITY_DN21274_c0_g1_i2:28-1323(+)
MAETAMCPTPAPQPLGKLALLNRTLAWSFQRRGRWASAAVGAGGSSSSSSQAQASALPRVANSNMAPKAPPPCATTPVPAPNTRRARSSCRAVADEWESRRIAEREFVLAHDTSNTDMWFLVDVVWLNDWKRFVMQGGAPPGPLRPDVLMDRRTGRPRPGMEPILDYRGVNADVWSYWLDRYGGGPPLRRRKVDLYARPVEDSVSPMVAAPPVSHAAVAAAPPVSERRASGVSTRAVAPGTTGRHDHGNTDGDDGNCAAGGDATVFFVKEANARIVSQPPDGSCLFHSLSFGLGDGSDAAALRLEISTFIAENPDLRIAGTALKDWVRFDSGGGVDAYAADVAGGTWGGGIEMEVFVRLKVVNVHVYEACTGGYRRICCFDAGPKAQRTLTVLYRERGSRGMEHYDALILGDSCGQWLPRTCVEPGAPGGA